jgi:hypothetical protein
MGIEIAGWPHWQELLATELTPAVGGNVPIVHHSTSEERFVSMHPLEWAGFSPARLLFQSLYLDFFPARK